MLIPWHLAFFSGVDHRRPAFDARDQRCVCVVVPNDLQASTGGRLHHSGRRFLFSYQIRDIRKINSSVQERICFDRTTYGPVQVLGDVKSRSRIECDEELSLDGSDPGFNRTVAHPPLFSQWNTWKIKYQRTLSFKRCLHQLQTGTILNA